MESWTIQLLADLRAAGYRPSAWLRFFKEAWHRARATGRDHTALVESWRILSLVVIAGTAGPVALTWRRHGSRPARRFAGLVLAGVVLQQADAYVHLGLNRRLRDGVLLPVIGPATWLSYTRGTIAYWLLAAIISGINLPGLAPTAVVVGALTDALDGPLARCFAQETKLGAYADGQADLILAIALTQAGARYGTLTAGARWLPAVRYALPIGVAVSYSFSGGRLPALEHTLAGRLSGVVQTGLLGCALAPSPFRLPVGARRLQVGIAAALSAASGITQSLRILRAGHAELRGLSDGR